MRIYSIYTGSEDSPEYFARLAPARRRAEELADFYGRDVDVRANETVPLRGAEGAILLLSGRGWAARSWEAYLAKPREVCRRRAD